VFYKISSKPPGQLVQPALLSEPFHAGQSSVSEPIQERKVVYLPGPINDPKHRESSKKCKLASESDSRHKQLPRNRTRALRHISEQHGPVDEDWIFSEVWRPSSLPVWDPTNNREQEAGAHCLNNPNESSSQSKEDNHPEEQIPPEAWSTEEFRNAKVPPQRAHPIFTFWRNR